MSEYQGDIVEDSTVYFKFRTIDGTGLPTTLLGTPALRVYKGNSVAQSTAGITLVVDFDSLTGLNHVTVVTTDAFYAAGEDYEVVVQAGTVDGISIVGYNVGSFSIENRNIEALGVYEGFIWYDAAASNTNTVLGVDGTPGNPVSSNAALKTLAAALGTLSAKIKGVLPSGGDLDNYDLYTWDGTGEVDCFTPNGDVPGFVGSKLHGLIVSGYAIMSNDTQFDKCIIGPFSNAFQGHAWNCELKGNIQLAPTAASETMLNDCYASDDTLTFDYQGATNQHTLRLNNFSGACNVEDMTHASAKLIVNSSSDTEIELEATCTLGSADFIGIGSLTDNSAGTSVTRSKWLDLAEIGLEATNQSILSTGSTGPWTTASIPATQDANVTEINGSATAAANLALWMDTIVTGTVNEVTPPTNGFEVTLAGGVTVTQGQMLIMQSSSSLGIGEARIISSDITASGPITLDKALRAAPANTDAFIILPAAQGDDLLRLNTELAAAPAITGGLRDFIKWVLTVSRNRITETSALQTIRNDADSADIATRTMSDNGTTFDSGKAT